MTTICNRPNLWPGEELPELREAFRELGALTIRVGLLLAGHCDRHAAARAADLADKATPCTPSCGGSAPAPARCITTPDGKGAAEQGAAGAAQERSLGQGHADEGESMGRSSLGTAAAGLGLQAVLARSPCPKGRLLHYFPLPGSPDAAERGNGTGRGSAVGAAGDARSDGAGSGSGGNVCSASAQDTGAARAKQGGGGRQIGVRAECSAGASAGEQGRLKVWGPEKPEQQGDWCGWHRDHGSLTGAVRCTVYSELSAQTVVAQLMAVSNQPPCSCVPASKGMCLLQPCEVAVKSPHPLSADFCKRSEKGHAGIDAAAFGTLQKLVACTYGRCIQLQSARGSGSC